MRSLLLNLALLLVPVCTASAATNEAQVSLHSLSLRFQPATAKLFGQEYAIEITTAGAQELANGELAPNVAGSSTHMCYYKLYMPDWPEPALGVLYLDTPDFVDANTNGLDDFFEVAQAIPAAKTSGTSEDILGQSTVTTTWSRDSGSSAGTCILNIENYALVFTHRFELLEYDGTLRYVALSSNVTAFVDLVQSDATTNILMGPVALSIVNSNKLSLGSGSWTNAAGEKLSYASSDEIVRAGTRYVGLISFDDFDLSTPTIDYALWVILVADQNDADGDGIPDLSDPAPPRPPLLALRQDANGLWLSVSGEVGRRYGLEQAVTLTQPQWTEFTSLTLTNDPQVVPVPLPAEATRFWRARTP
jgi:hypothetical protein